MFCSEIFLGEFQMDVKTIAVIGAGTMGRGIAYAAAIGGYRTVLEDVAPAVLAQGVDYLRKSLEEGGGRGKAPPELQQSAFERLSTSKSVEDACRQADLVIEAVP